MTPGIEPPQPLDVVYIAMETAIALVSVTGNVLVVAAVYVNRALRNTTFFFIVSLAVADIAVGLLVIPLAIVVSLGLKTQFYTCLFLSCLLLIITQSSILSLLAIAIDRYLRVKIPTKYSSVVTQERAWASVALCWGLSLVTGMVPMSGWNNRDPQSHDATIPCTFTGVMRMDYMVYFNFFALVVAPLAAMICLYVEIFRVIRRRLNSRAEATCDAERYYRKELRLVESLALVVFLFVLCWMPLHVMNCVSFFCDGCRIPTVAMNVGIFMSHVNSAVNPMVYAFRIKRFRVTLVEITKRCMLCKRTRPTAASSTHAASEKTTVD